MPRDMESESINKQKNKWNLNTSENRALWLRDLRKDIDFI